MLSTWNGHAVALSEVPCLAFDALRAEVVEAVRGGARLASLFGDAAGGGEVALYAVLADDSAGKLLVASARVKERFPSLTPDCPQAHLFERELAEQLGLTPEGHPWLKPVRFEPPSAQGAPRFGLPPIDQAQPRGEEPAKPIPGEYPFFAMSGAEVHEVAVGPVHAGVIEPGHFRFQCHGEVVFHLEIQLGYQHRGVEKLLAGGPTKRSSVVAESIAGDSVIAHMTAHCMAQEALAGMEAPPRAQAIRGVALELERLANHVGDLGALAGDVGFLPTSAYCGRLRAEFLNASAELCGSRFGRSLVVPGGVRFDIAATQARRLSERIANAWRQVKEAAALFFDSPSVRSRTDGIGVVSRETALALGLVGPSVRSCGIQRDVRRDHPFGIYRFAHVPVVVADSGDVFARAWIRLAEGGHSVEFVRDQLASLPGGAVRGPVGPLAPGRLALALVEGWRGAALHAVVTNAQGRFGRYKVKDPSFHNWMGLAMALRGEQISDFPLNNKSFNLSYAGHDL